MFDFSFILCDCVGGVRGKDALSTPENESMILMVKFGVRNFKNWYKKFQEERHIYNALGVDIFVGERKQGFILAETFVDIVHVCPRPKVNAIKAVYNITETQSTDEKQLTWIHDQAITTDFDIKEYDLILRDDAGDLTDAELMTTVSCQVTDFADYIVTLANREVDAKEGTGAVKSFIARDENLALNISLYSKMNEKLVSASFAYDNENATIIQPVVKHTSKLHYKRSVGDA
uniref:Uncharacterized protein n=1 Tax=Aureoumbra lagunensis TaxID=44058 RepID=A0A7S3K6K7_9STRA|mmetsp:Transcript_21975/g.33905  ORF Transcript_21975/g.33905 Transcript_21975/m.33905 type:complete len:232 (+) Transcript_21975:25-720(+)